MVDNLLVTLTTIITEFVISNFSCYIERKSDHVSEHISHKGEKQQVISPKSPDWQLHFSLFFEMTS